jgi:hypothetical protein
LNQVRTFSAVVNALRFSIARQDAQELGPANVVDRHLLEARQHVLVEDPQDLRQRAVPAFLEFLAAMLDPRIEDGLEGVVARQLGRVPLLVRSVWGLMPLASSARASSRSVRASRRLISDSPEMRFCLPSQ